MKFILKAFKSEGHIQKILDTLYPATYPEATIIKK